MIKTVFFDFGGTLAYEPLSHVDSLYRFLRDRGIETTPEEVAQGEHGMQAYGAAWAAERGDGRSKALADRYWFNVCLRFAKHIKSMPDPHDLAELLHASHEIIPYRLYEDTFPTLRALSRRGLTLGIISNWDAPTLEFATRDLGIRRFFRMVLSSRCAECEKPRPAIFHEACRRAHADPATSIHVGDSIVADVEGAKAVGITPVWINRNGAPSTPDSRVIRTLAELPTLIDAL